MANSNQIPALETFLHLTECRERTLTSNMANVDTPGYHAKDINFQGELKKAMNTAYMPTANGSAQLNPAVNEEQGLLERPDGNNVDLDREGMMMAQTQLQFQLGIQLIKREFHQILSAINGGGSGS